MNTQEWPSVEEQLAYWEKKDIGGNVIPDRIQSNLMHFDHERIEDARIEARLDAIAEREDQPGLYDE